MTDQSTRCVAAWLLACILLDMPLLILAFFVAFAAPAAAHDSWISRDKWRNPAGEWCCGADDCALLDGEAVHFSPQGYRLDGHGTVFPTDSRRSPFRVYVKDDVPASEVLPSQDGAYWRCQASDGRRRCFFAPQPVM